MQHLLDLMPVPDKARMLFCEFVGDPETDSNWKARPLRDVSRLNDRANIYWTVSAFYPAAEGGWRRRKRDFAAGCCLMIDDLGTKGDMSIISPLAPTCLVETSPGNFQAIYVFSAPILDQRTFKALIDAFIDAKFLDSKDPGMSGVTRVFRPPMGFNRKKKYGKPWPVRSATFDPSARYSLDQIVAAFGLTLKVEDRPVISLMSADARNEVEEAERNRREFELVYARLGALGFKAKGDWNRDGWLEITCPWVHNHTGGLDNGAAIAAPSPENRWHGGFRCHHGGCDKKDWRDFLDVVSEATEGLLEQVNKDQEMDWVAKAHDGLS